MLFIGEADSLAAAGAALDRFMADPQGAPLTATGPESPVASYRLTMWADIPLDGPSAQT